MSNDYEDFEKEPKEPKLSRVNDATLRLVVARLGKALLSKPGTHSCDYLASDKQGHAVSVWGDSGVKRSIQGWVLKIAYDLLGHSQSRAYNVMSALNAKVLEKTEGKIGIEGIETETKDGPRAVLVLLLQIFSEKKK